MAIEPDWSEPLTRVRAETEIDQELLRWVDEQAARSGRSRDEVLEEAVRRGRQAGRPLVEIASAAWERRVRIVADTNVLVSALPAPGGGLDALLAAVDAGEVILVAAPGPLGVHVGLDLFLRDPGAEPVARQHLPEFVASRGAYAGI